MPVVTRSQSIKIQEQPIQEDNTGILLHWFQNVIRQNILDINKNLNEKRKFELVLNENNESQFRRIHYDLLRRITEMFYTINMYYPLVESSKTNSLTITMYQRIMHLYGELYDELYDLNVELMPKNYDEYKVMSALLTELKDAEKMLIQYVPYDKQFKQHEKNIIAKVNKMFNDAQMKLL